MHEKESIKVVINVNKEFEATSMLVDSVVDRVTFRSTKTTSKTRLTVDVKEIIP